MKQRTYNVCNDVKYAHRLIPIVTAPSQSADGKPRVLWSKFHDTLPVDDSSAAGREGSLNIWPEQGQLPDPAGTASHDTIVFCFFSFHQPCRRNLVYVWTISQSS